MNELYTTIAHKYTLKQLKLLIVRMYAYTLN